MNTHSIANGMLFINDDMVIGKWNYYDSIKSKEDFNCSQSNHPISENGFKEIYFLPDGEKYWIFEGWTKGYLLIHYGGDDPILCYQYSIKTVNNRDFMFLEIANENYICVLKKISDKKYNINEIGHRDNINLPFVLDSNVLGTWESVGFVNEIEQFLKPIISKDDLWLKSIIFNKDGTAIRKYSDETWTDKWTRDFLLDYKKSTASKYVVKVINNIQYLFVEWKMGNYVYGGAKPSYYVFEKSKG